MELLERAAFLTDLETALRDAVNGEGRVALVSGEAGIGKTSLVERFAHAHKDAHVLWGACDALFTPRPLGPLHDMAAQSAGNLQSLLDADASRNTIFSAVLGELQGHLTLAVFEDVHWADEATLDLLRFLSRRIARTTALLVITYRDDELGARHPLRTVLGDLSTSPAVRRISLPPLTKRAVRSLVGERGVDASALHHQTGGNPFFVTEALANEGTGLPTTVRDAVLARVARLSPSAEAVLQAAAVIGPRIEPWVLAEVTGAEATAAGECLAAGMLVAQGEVLSFRHELARQTILESTSPLHKMALHRMTLDALKAVPAPRQDLARLAHHAEGARDREAVLEYAPAAARHASATRAHREAATLYALALRFASDLSPAEHAELLSLYAEECNCVDLREEGMESCQKLLEIWGNLHNPLKRGETHSRLANMLIGLGKTSEAEQQSREAIAILEAEPHGRELALAYRMQAALDMLNHNHQESIGWAEKDIALSERDHDAHEVLSARTLIGTALMFLDYEQGCQYLEENIVAATDAGREVTVAHAYANLSSVSCELYQLRRAERYWTAGIAYAADRDLDRLRLYMVGWQAITLLRLGRWDEAVEVAHSLLQRPGVSVTSRVTALAALGSVYARRGESAWSTLDEALELARPIGSLHRVGLVSAARAEAAWLDGDTQRAAEEARTIYDLAVSKEHPWFTGELAYWRWRAGDTFSLPTWTAKPFALHIAGDWRGAAEEWEQLGCPYEQAHALADGDTTAQTAALEIFGRLGARPAAEALKRTLRTDGAVVPRGPRPTTRENPFSLTARQMEILHLLTVGLSNIEIAARLHISPKTADHHVSAVLGKLDVHSREAAAALARSHALLQVK